MSEYECPERFCIAAFRPDELRAHLRMDHGKSERRADRVLEDLVDETTDDKQTDGDRRE